MKGSALGGYFITFEGGEGAGKSTVVKQIHQHLSEKGINVLSLREPGGTKVGDSVREMLFNPETATNMHEKTEVMSFQTSRAQIIHEAVKPHLEVGGIILLDRHGDSSIAYQGYARGIGASQIADLNNFSTGGLVPDLTLWFDVDPDIGISRAKSRSENWNHLDEMQMQFHRDVHHAYSTLHAYDTEDRWQRIDANQDLEQVVTETKLIIESELISAGILEGQSGSPERRG